MTHELAPGTFPVRSPCPKCVNRNVFGFMEVDGETGKHQHTRYLCRTWQCGWEGRVVPNLQCACGDFVPGEHEWVDTPDGTRHTVTGCTTMTRPPLVRPAPSPSQVVDERTGIKVPEHLLRRAWARHETLEATQRADDPLGAVYDRIGAQVPEHLLRRAKERREALEKALDKAEVDNRIGQGSQRIDGRIERGEQ